MNTTNSGRVVVGVDNTLAGYQALRFAVQQARQRGVPLIAVRAFARARFDSLEWRIAITVQAEAEIDECFVDALGGRPTDIDIESVVEPGPAGRLLCVTANRADDMLVIGGSTRRPAWRWFAPARTARRCAQSATCPVTVIPEPIMARSRSLGHLGRGIADDAARFLQAH
ncbi:MAG: universal stress protein [Betaproteobacteria bacterium]